MARGKPVPGTPTPRPGSSEFGTEEIVPQGCYPLGRKSDARSTVERTGNQKYVGIRQSAQEDCSMRSVLMGDRYFSLSGFNVYFLNGYFLRCGCPA